MLYTELLGLWDEAVKAVDARDWHGALVKLNQITDPPSRILFTTASVHLALGQLEPAVKALDQTIAKDERLAVGFFQRAGAYMHMNRLEEALTDCIWAQKHMRENVVIDYRQLGLRYKLYSWQVLYNAAAVHCRLGQWARARAILLSALEEKGEGKGNGVEAALEGVSRKEFPAPLLVPEGEVFRPRKQDIEQLKERDFLGKPKVIVSMIPNDDFGGFEPLRMQKPGYYEPKTDGSQDSRYMRVSAPCVGSRPGQLSVPAGALVFMFSDVDRDGMATVIFDGQKGLVPRVLLEPTDVKESKSKKKKNKIPSGIPLPPGLKPPTRPQMQPTSIAPTLAQPDTKSPPPPEVQANVASADPDMLPPTDESSPEQEPSSPEREDAGSMVVKVHYRYTVALTVPMDTTHGELQRRIAHKLGQPASLLRLRHRQHGTQILRPLDGEGLRALLEGAEAGRATLWCQTEDSLASRTILYQMVALYDYTAEGSEDLEFSEGDTIDILSQVNEDWLEGHCAGRIGIFPSCFAYRDNENPQT